MTMANQQTQAMHEAVREVHTTNEFILKRINQLFPGESTNGHECTCECHNEDTLKALLTRVHDLEDKEKETDTIVEELSEQIKGLKAYIKEAQVHRPASSLSKLYESTSGALTAGTKYSNLKAIGIKDTEDLRDVGFDCVIKDTNVDDVMDKSGKHEAETLNDNIKTDTYFRDHSVVEELTRVAQTKIQSQKHLSHNEIDTNQSDEISGRSTEDKCGDTDDGDGLDKDTCESNIELSSNKKETVDTGSDEKGDCRLKATSELHTDPNLTCPKVQTTESNVTVAERSLKNINKPNFSKSTSSVMETKSATAAVKVVETKIKKYYPSHEAWLVLSNEERRNARAPDQGLKNLGGVHTVICLDISASMAKSDGWTQVTSFFNSFISGLEDVATEHGIRDEHVALVTFGHETRVVQRLTNDFRKLRQAFNRIKLGGPTPMFGGLHMATVAAGSSDKTVAVINGIQVNTKVVVITDGEPTDTCMHQGPDECEANNQDETKTLILTVMEHWQNLPSLDFYCVAVGNANKEFLQLMVTVADGNMLRHEDGRSFSRRVFLTVNATLGPLGILESMLGSSDFMIDMQSDLSESDREQLRDIMDKAKKNVLTSFSRKVDTDQYREIDNGKLPTVGSRVRRGPDWMWKEQDSHGPGTVIGHSIDDCQVWVEWDADKNRNIYRYGFGGDYDIRVVDEPRTVGPGDMLMVGCVVKPGVYFVQGDKMVSPHEKGVVIKVLSSDPQKVQVRWNNRVRGDYSYGDKGVFEVELWQSLGKHAYGLQSEIVPVKRTQNKNKNMK